FSVTGTDYINTNGGVDAFILRLIQMVPLLVRARKHRRQQACFRRLAINEPSLLSSFCMFQTYVRNFAACVSTDAGR
ncbi:hypothetical protein, partial [Salmonella enterica]|uniref:hypothetical protein n=1 Tax=Salmonella enterica TaxID=28901 RepID=UPI0021B19243